MMVSLVVLSSGGGESLTVAAAMATVLRVQLMVVMATTATMTMGLC